MIAIEESSLYTMEPRKDTSAAGMDVAGAAVGLLAVTSLLFPVKLPLAAGLFIPNAPFLALMGALALVAWRKLITLSAFAGAMVLFCLFNLLTTSYEVVPVAEKLKSVALLVFYFTGFLLLVGSSSWFRERRRTIGYICLAFSAIWLALATLEVFVPPVKEASDQFRRLAYNEEVLYGATNRDLLIVGRDRPKAFMSEPAKASFAVGALAFLGVAALRSKRVQIVAAGLSVGAGAVIGSPVALIFLCFSVYFFTIPGGTSVRSRAIRAAASGGILAIVGLILYFSLSSLQNRVEMAESGVGSSTYMRTVFQWELAWQGLLHNPISGVGIGGEAEISEFLFSKDGVEPRESSRAVLAPFWSIFLFSGLAGMAFFLATFYFLSKTFGVFPFIVACEAFVLLFQQFGGIQSTRVWIVFGLLLALGVAQFDEEGSREIGDDDRGEAP